MAGVEDVQEQPVGARDDEDRNVGLEVVDTLADVLSRRRRIVFAGG